MVRFPTLPPPVQVVTSQPMGQSNNNVREEIPQQEKFKPDPIPITYIKLYPKLVRVGLLSPVDIPPLQPPYLDGIIDACRMQQLNYSYFQKINL